MGWHLKELEKDIHGEKTIFNIHSFGGMKHTQQPSKASGATKTTNANTNEEDEYCQGILYHTPPNSKAHSLALAWSWRTVLQVEAGKGTRSHMHNEQRASRSVFCIACMNDG